MFTTSCVYALFRYDESTGRKRSLEEELSDLEGKLERAEKLVTGLAGERIRW
jgi:dynein heavy chain